MVPSFPFGPITVWTLALWLLGWLVLPLSRRLFAALPDGGLAAGRLVFIILVSLLLFWGASLRFLPLGAAPLLALAGAGAGLWSWNSQPETRVWARQNWRALAFSDAVFLLAWGAFLTLRLFHPEAGDLEKPMDAALLSSAWKADYLPFQSPWFSGELFTNYYYFGPLMGAGMARGLATPPQIAYNLVQPAFCAFFLSITWSVGAALTRSKIGGILVVVLVGLSGPLEPLRQRLEGGVWWPLDWWKTSRVIPDTINEYPAFTMSIGDAHAHFYALSLAALWLALLWQLFFEGANRRLILVVCGLVLGAWLMTNTWDAPVFGLLLGLTILATRPAPRQTLREIGEGASPGAGFLWAMYRAGWQTILARVAPFVIAIVAATPYFRSYHAQISGAAFDVWAPNLASFALLWGGWGLLATLAFLLPPIRDEGARFRRLLLGAGVVALLVPYFFYIRGAFGDGDLRHQDTVFKFGLQAWILLGTGISAELGARLIAAFGARQSPLRFAATLGLAVLAPLLTLAPASVIWTRAVAQGTTVTLDQSASLDAMRFLPQAEQDAILWLQTNGLAGESVMENVKIENGQAVGDYDANFARVGAFSGLSSTLGWPQHAWVWGADYGAVQNRGKQIANLYALQSPLETARGAAQWGARYSFFGRNEGSWTPPSDADARAAGFSVHQFQGADGSRAMIIERIGR